MSKYANLIYGGLIFLAAIAVIVWTLKQDSDNTNAALQNTPTSPDENGVEPLNGLEPNNQVVEVAGSHLTYNVPQPGLVAPIQSNQDYLTQGQALVSASDSADDVIRNLMAVSLPASDYIQ